MPRPGEGQRDLGGGTKIEADIVGLVEYIALDGELGHIDTALDTELNLCIGAAYGHKGQEHHGCK